MKCMVFSGLCQRVCTSVFSKVGDIGGDTGLGESSCEKHLGDLGYTSQFYCLLGEMCTCK